MMDWFGDLVEELIWKALNDFFHDLSEAAEAEIESRLAELEPDPDDKPLSSSPLVRVLAVDANTITLLVRGRVKLWKKAASAFMRIEVVISKDIDLSAQFPITIVDWNTVIGDLKISKKNVFEAQLAFGFDGNTWLGRGALKLLPAGFGLDVFLGGLNDRGAMVGLDIDLPAPVPLGSTGLCLTGMGGDFAYNFVPRLEKLGIPVEEPTAADYVSWAMNDEADRWDAGPIDETAVGVAIRTDLATIFDNGWSLSLAPVGLAVLVPGPVFVFGGKGKLLKTNSAKVSAFAAVDIPTKSIALGATAEIKIPERVRLLEASGAFNAYFSFEDPGAWYLRLGTQTKEHVKCKFVKSLTGNLWLNIDNHRVFLGVGVSIGGEWEAWKVKVFANAGAVVAALIGYNPGQLGGHVEINGELGVKVWKIKLSLSAAARAIGNFPDPAQLEAEFRFKINLPWPVPDVKGKTRYSLSDDAPNGPPLASPLLADGTSASPLQVGAAHALSGRQWMLAATTKENGVWPDAEIVIPFSARVRDDVGAVVAPAVGPSVQGGYSVDHVLTELRLENLVDSTAMTPTAVWAAGPGGDTAALHVLGTDPFSWLSPHTDVITHANETPARYVQQTFGVGDTEVLNGLRRFGDVAVESPDATLIDDFWPSLPTRLLRSREITLSFATVDGSDISVDRLLVYVIGAARRVGTPAGAFSPIVMGPIGPGTIVAVYDLPGDLELFALDVPLSGGVSRIELSSGGKLPLHVWAIRYREARELQATHSPRILLAPGRYRIKAAGKSTANHVFQDPDKGPLPSSDPVDWELEQEFWVRFPETLRPYIAGMSLGDTRILGPETSEWNPTMYGFGFPAYQSYHCVVRFKVPYMSSVFAELTMRVNYESGPSLDAALAPMANPDGDSTLATISQAWVEAAGGTVKADEELVWSTALPKAGAAQVKLGFIHPDDGEVKLDEWTCYVSEFGTFADHLAWSETSLTVAYDAGGRRMAVSCPTIVAADPRPRGSRIGRRIDTRFELSRSVDRRKARPFLLGRPPVLDHFTVTPKELTAPPATWRLDAAMGACLGPLAQGTGTCFARFALLTGARFNSGTGETLAGIADTVADVSIEAVLDGEDRLFALWLRTPEPVDWRRVTAKLRIHHVLPEDECPEKYAQRSPLELGVAALPSPDASSAFLIGNMDGVHTRMPRGEYELDLWFDADVDGLFPLRPATPGAEHVKLRFICNFGKDWPKPRTFIPIPAGALEDLMIRFRISPDAVQKAIKDSSAPRPWPGLRIRLAEEDQ